jgi:hypothetical protein
MYKILRIFFLLEDSIIKLIVIIKWKKRMFSFEIQNFLYFSKKKF